MTSYQVINWCFLQFQPVRINQSSSLGFIRLKIKHQQHDFSYLSTFTLVPDRVIDLIYRYERTKYFTMFFYVALSRINILSVARLGSHNFSNWTFICADGHATSQYTCQLYAKKDNSHLIQKHAKSLFSVAQCLSFSKNHIKSLK